MDSGLPHILVVDYEGTATRILQKELLNVAQVTGVTNTRDAEQNLRHHDIDVLVCRDDLPGETGIMFFTRLRDKSLWQRRILICPPLDSELALFLINETNIFRCITLPPEPAILVQTVEAALVEAKRIRHLVSAERENERLRTVLQETTRRSPQGLTLQWVRSLPRLAGLALLTFGSIFALGVATLLALYLLKTLLGIDLFPGAHLSDAVP
ncbi:MAG: hypothetical protein R3F03_03135 [Opitutaceae bacterium]